MAQVPSTSGPKKVLVAESFDLSCHPGENNFLLSLCASSLFAEPCVVSPRSPCEPQPSMDLIILISITAAVVGTGLGAWLLEGGTEECLGRGQQRQDGRRQNKGPEGAQWFDAPAPVVICVPSALLSPSPSIPSSSAP